MGNVETVQRMYQAFGAGDVPAILELLVLEANLPAWGGGHYRDEEMHLWTFARSGGTARQETEAQRDPRVPRWDVPLPIRLADEPGKTLEAGPVVLDE
jgi:hypothetical protein